MKRQIILAFGLVVYVVVTMALQGCGGEIKVPGPEGMSIGNIRARWAVDSAPGEVIVSCDEELAFGGGCDCQAGGSAIGSKPVTGGWHCICDSGLAVGYALCLSQE